MSTHVKVKCVLLMVFPQDGEAPYGDATKEWMLRHIEQLRPIFSEFEDVIDVVQAGFIGVWGTLSPQTRGLYILLKLYKIYLNYYSLLLLYQYTVLH